MLDALVAANYINHDPAIPGPPPRPEALKPVVAAFRAGFPDRHATIEDQIAEADKLVTRFILQGTHQGDCGGIPAPGNQITVAAMTIKGMAGGKRVEHWRQSDVLGMMQQLGVILPFAQGGSPA